MAFNLDCTLESPKEIQKLPMPWSHPWRLLNNWPEVRPKHWGFQSSSGHSNRWPRLTANATAGTQKLDGKLGWMTFQDPSNPEVSLVVDGTYAIILY